MIVQNSVDKIVTLTINRPNKANALTESMLVSLIEALDAAADSPTRAVIVTGNGRTFSAGADLDEARAGLVQSDLWNRLSARMATMPCLTIAAINGTIAGGAFGMMLASDIRIAVPSAQFFYPVMRLGFLPPESDPRRLAALIGVGRAKMILMAGARISADEARNWGLVDQVVQPERLIPVAQGLATDVLSASPEHVMAIKSMIA